MQNAPVIHLRFDINTCLIDPNNLLKDSLTVIQGEKVSIAVRVWNNSISKHVAIAHVYSKLMQLIYPDHSLEPLDANYTLPNTKYGQKFENQHQLKEFIRMNEMGFSRDKHGNEYFCHTYLPRCSWVNNHYSNNPVGFSAVTLGGEIQEVEYESMPESLRIDVNEVLENGTCPLINTMVLKPCIAENILPNYFDFISKNVLESE